MILGVCELLCFPKYLSLSSSPLSSSSASFTRLRGHVNCSGFAKSIGPSTISPRSTPEMQLLSSSCESCADLVGDFGGFSSRFVGGALVFGAGGGGALLLDFAAFPRSMAFLVRGVVLEVGFLVRAFSLSFFSRFSLRIWMSPFSSFCVLSISFRKFPNLFRSCRSSFFFLFFSAFCLA